MVIQRVNPGNWSQGQDLSFEDINQLDTNATYGLDHRDGYTDTLASAITVTGSVEWQTGSDLVLDDPSVFKVASDNGSPLYIGAELRGDNRGSAADPLRFGYQSVVVTSPAISLSASQANTFVIRLTGTLTADTAVIFPSTAGYAKIVDNQIIHDGYQLALTTPTQTTPELFINQDSQQFVYCDGVNLNFGPQKVPFEVVDYVTQNDGYSFAGSGVYVTTTSAALTKVTNGSDTYSNQFSCQINDVLDISYSAGTKPGASSTNYIELIVQITRPDLALVTLNETAFININSGTAFANYFSSNTQYTCVQAGTHTVAIYMKVNAGTGSVLLPITFTIKQTR